jgi:hypothetical protein
MMRGRASRGGGKSQSRDMCHCCDAEAAFRARHYLSAVKALR